MAQPLKEGSSPFCLCIFGSDNKFKSIHVQKRWEWIQAEAVKYGITVEGYSSDGDTRCLSAMIALYMPRQPQTLPKGFEPWFVYDFKPTCMFTQDTTHILAKLRTRLLKHSTSLLMGKFVVSQGFLRALINDVPKENHGRCRVISTAMIK